MTKFVVAAIILAAASLPARSQERTYTLTVTASTGFAMGAAIDDKIRQLMAQPNPDLATVKKLVDFQMSASQQVQQQNAAFERNAQQRAAVDAEQKLREKLKQETQP